MSSSRNYIIESNKDGSVKYTIKNKGWRVGWYPDKTKEIKKCNIKEDDQVETSESLKIFINDILESYSNPWIDGNPYYQVEEGLLVECNTYYDYHIARIAESIINDNELPFKGFKWPEDFDRESVKEDNLESFLDKIDPEVIDFRN